jgi:hypothetical protein
MTSNSGVFGMSRTELVERSIVPLRSNLRILGGFEVFWGVFEVFLRCFGGFFGVFEVFLGILT